MKHNRILSVLLALCMLTTLIAGCFTASAAGSTINTGTRHELCEALSADATAYYKGSNSWDSLSALSGKDTQSSVEACGTPLFNALHNLMWNTLTTTVSYKSLTSYWSETDRSAGSKDACLIYADAISSSYNREHVWPKSHGNFYESGAGSDLHHLRPSDQTINSTRNHWTFGNVKKLLSSYKTKEYGGKTVLWYDTGYTGNNCLGLVEVNDNVKGDIARILLYVYVTYGKTSGENLNLFTKTSASGSGNNANTGDKIIYDRDTLLEWCENDPVDTWEMSRNDCCAAVQGNRNVFIDYPEFAWLLFGQEVPDMDTPSGMAHELQGGTTYTVTAVSSDETMGTVTGTGRSFTAVPNDGYYVTGYTLEPSEAATVTQTGNTFTLTKPTADCTLTVKFAAKTPATLSFSVPAGVSCANIPAYSGDDVTLPTPSGKPTGEYEYTFKGWVALTYDNVTDKPATIYPAGSAYTLNGNTTLYALYTYSIGGTGSSTEFTKITTQEELTNGSYVFTSSATGKAMKTDVGSNWVYPGGTYTGETIDTPAATDIWEYADGKIFYTGGALTCSSAKSISLTDEGTPWTITATSGVWTLISNGNTLSFNNTGWRPYGNGGYGNDKTFYVYKAGSGGTMYYTTIIGEPCEHTYVSEMTEPTCLNAGYTTYTCSKCGSSYKADEIAALGHDYVTETIAPTATEKGYDLHTCSRCGDSYKDNYTLPIDPLCEHTNTELRDVKAPTCTEIGYTGDLVCSDCGDVLEQGTMIAPLGHDYEDGICSRCGDEDPNFDPPVPTDPCEGYTDIDRTAWYHKYIDFAIKNGLMSSTRTDALTFEPSASCTRAMIVTILYSLTGKPDVSYEAVFPDVADKQWYTKPIMWAYQNDVVDGYNTGNFGPNDKITREQMAVILKAYTEKIVGDSTSATADLSRFADANKVTWSKPYVCWAVAEGLLAGKAEDGQFILDPQGKATRAEVAAILMKYINK